MHEPLNDVARALAALRRPLPPSLTYRETIIMQILLKRAGEPVSKVELERALYGGKVVESNNIQTIIYSLRVKFGRDSVRTVWHIGYRLSDAFLRLDAPAA